MAVAAIDQQTQPRRGSDPALVQACLDGDATAWETLIDRYGRLVYAVARRSGASPEDADDVFQVVFTTLFRRLPGLRDQTRLSSWLLTTTHRESWRVGRAGRLAGHTVEVDETIADAAEPPADEVARLEREQAVREALGEIDARCRDLLTALFLEPAAPSYEAIGARLGMPVGSIGPTRARCFKKLETVLVGMGLETGF